MRYHTLEIKRNRPKKLWLDRKPTNTEPRTSGTNTSSPKKDRLVMMAYE